MGATTDNREYWICGSSTSGGLTQIQAYGWTLYVRKCYSAI